MNKDFSALLLVGLALLLPVAVAADEAAVESVLDRFHRAAAAGDFDAYFSLMTRDAVFLGTDGSERWQGEEFRKFSRPHFAAGGWSYHPLQRRVAVDRSRGVAWFDELLSHASLGQCRGSGVLLQQAGSWKIAQYNLSVPIPNELVADVAALIQAEGRDDRASPETGAEADRPDVQTTGDCRRKRHKTNSKAGCKSADFR